MVFTPMFTKYRRGAPHFEVGVEVYTVVISLLTRNEVTKDEKLNKKGVKSPY